ncbi:helix-turn-helix domain-containing protein [Actinocrispum sp. NPDC049592]|uniref:GlxA family transcriptional regulator n=1 Tax=Actinocrispum sp. NPDC049592 TaxID=3154835 RepID=UPI003449B856
MGERITVAILVVPRVIALDYSIPAHILGGCEGYRLSDDPTQADIVVVPGFEEPEKPLPATDLDVIRQSADRGARIVGICTGTFGLAASGVLNGRSATTHWQYVAQLRELYPKVLVLENRLFVEDGKILTSAGAGAGIDACLHMIRSDFGEAAAHDAGKGVVAAPARTGDQLQYVDVLTPPRATLAATRAWVMENIGEPITVQRMAMHSNLPRRTFIRHFENETGMPPMRWVVLQRILSARRLLERSDWSIERIAAATGFGTATNFRTVFRREVGSTPSAYRKAIQD